MRSSQALEWVQNLKNGVGTHEFGKLENGLETLYLSLKISFTSIHLTDIYLPESEQHQGFGTAIISALEKKAFDWKLDLIIGPLMSWEDEKGNEYNHLETLLMKRQYLPCSPFCLRWAKDNVAAYL